MDLVEDGKLKSDEATQKAIAASQYLVDGKNEIDETELLLNKILCGADLDFYVDDTLVLNEIELGICDMAHNCTFIPGLYQARAGICGGRG